jgi:hypothetical protein
VTILCNSRSAVQTTQNPRNRSGERIVHATLQAATKVQAEGIATRLQWMPGHCDNPGKNAADRLAKDVVRAAKPIPFVRYCQGRLHDSGAISLPSGSRNGGYPTVTYGRSTPPCQQPTQEGYIGACQGSRYAYWPNFAPATIGYLPKLKHMTFSVTTSACVARKRRLPKCWWTVQGSGRSDESLESAGRLNRK